MAGDSEFEGKLNVGGVAWAMLTAKSIEKAVDANSDGLNRKKTRLDKNYSFLRLSLRILYIILMSRESRCVLRRCLIKSGGAVRCGYV